MRLLLLLLLAGDEGRKEYQEPAIDAIARKSYGPLVLEDVGPFHFHFGVVH